MTTKNLFKSVLVTICCISVIAFTACSSDDDNNNLNDTLKTNIDKIEVFAGSTGNIIIMNGKAPYTAFSNESDIATAEVDENTIVVTGVKEGVAIIHIIDKNKLNAKVVVNVKDGAEVLILDKKDVTIDVDKNDVVTVVGGTEPYTATVNDETIATAEVNENKVTIKGVKAGTTTITITDKEGKKGTVSVTIK